MWCIILYEYKQREHTINNNFTGKLHQQVLHIHLGNITGGAFEYTGSSNLASNGTLVSGENSAIYLNGSAITAAPGATNVAAVALNGSIREQLPAGMTAGTDGENNGTITLGDSSVGIYGKNGSRISNRGYYNSRIMLSRINDFRSRIFCKKQRNNNCRSRFTGNGI
jgi:hypothetical protein